MAAQLVKVVPSMFPRIFDDLLDEFDPSFGVERWKRIFYWPWENPEDHVGYALIEDNGPVVGYAGFLYSQQEISGRQESICNITTWVVKDSHRSAAMALVMPTLLRRDITITNLTSIRDVNQIFSRLGFHVLETDTIIFFPRPWWTSTPFQISRVTEDTTTTPPKLSPSRQILMKDHASLCEHLIVHTAEGEESHISFTRSRRWKTPLARIHHIDNAPLFVRSLPRLHLEFLKMGLLLLECDARLVHGEKIPFSRQVPLGETRLYRSSRLSPSDLSNLYSELVLLNI